METGGVEHENNAALKPGMGLARHNDRDFDITHADHIDPGKQKENSYLNVYRDKNMTFQEAELKFYTEAFADLLQDMNARAVAARHAERCKTPADLLKSKRQPRKRSFTRSATKMIQWILIS